MLHRDDLSRLAMFMAVAEAQSFTKAATRLGMSQSALSHAMQRLEAKLGFRLLARTTRSVSVTEAGRQLIETLRPALDDIDGKLTTLAKLRDHPGGTIRISAAEHAAKAILWPAVDKLIGLYPDIKVEISVDAALTNIVAEGFDAGIRLGERLEKDMIAVPVSPKLRMAAVGSPRYFENHPIPRHPSDLAHHSCINLRMPGGQIYVWEFSKNGREINVSVDGQLVTNRVEQIVMAAEAGHGIAFIGEGHVTGQLENGSLIRVLEDWCEPFEGYFLYYPSRRQNSQAFTLLVDALRYRR